MGLGDISRLLSSQPAGRMQPVGWTAPDGSYVVLIGSERDDRESALVAGERFGFERKVLLTDVTTITWAMRFRQSSSTELAFRAVVTIDGVPFWEEQLDQSAVSDHEQRVINVTDVLGLRDVGFYLLAVSP